MQAALNITNSADLFYYNVFTHFGNALCTPITFLARLNCNKCYSIPIIIIIKILFQDRDVYVVVDMQLFDYAFIAYLLYARGCKQRPQITQNPTNLSPFLIPKYSPEMFSIVATLFISSGTSKFSLQNKMLAE